MSHVRVLHVCSFEAVELPRRGLTYEKFREAVLKAGRFSVFEATETARLARWYTRLCAEPDVVVDNKTVGFPWTKIRLKTDDEKQLEAAAERDARDRMAQRARQRLRIVEDEQ